MAEVLNTYASLTAEQKDYYVRSLLDRLTPELHFAKYGQKKPAPKGEGATLNFRRFNSIAPKITPLTEGKTPEGSSLDIATIKATVQQYGDYIKITDKIQSLAFDPVLTQAVQLLGESAGQTIDQVVREVVCTGTNVQYAGGKTSRAAVAAADKLTAMEIKKAVRTLRRANAKPLEGGFYIGIIDPDTAFDLMGDPLWEDLSKYGSGVNIEKGEVGKLGGVRFVQTTETKVYPGQGAGGADVHATMILGKDAYGVCDIAGSSKPEIIMKGLGSGEDPLNQRASAGWKALFTAVRLQELAMVRIESGVTA